MARAPLILALLALTVQPARPQALAPGKPAGTQAAQQISYRTAFIGISTIAVTLVFALPGSTTTSTVTSTATTG